MFAGTASLCSTLLFFSVFMFVSSDQKVITADIGDSVILPCRVTNKITAVKWIKHYLGVYQDNKVDSDNQHSFFKRCDVYDVYDNGTYHCHVKVAETNSWKYISYIYLYVVPPGRSGGLGGSIGLIVGVVVAVMVVSLCLSFCFCTALRNIVTRYLQTRAQPRVI
ncbi:hypothetical protein ACER0C_002369 [Sarotherodon galilaeus]